MLDDNLQEQKTILIRQTISMLGSFDCHCRGRKSGICSCWTYEWTELSRLILYPTLRRLTYKNESCYTMSAYRVHERDPVVFQNGLGLVWRNSDELPGDDTGAPSWLCPMSFPLFPNTSRHRKITRTTLGAILDVDVEFQVWIYEWETK